MKEVDVSSLEHTSWRCQYHVVFAPRYRRMEIYGKIKEDIGVILCKLCQQKGVEIIEAQACPDHIHMLISIPPKYSVSQIMGYLKGKSSLYGGSVDSSRRYLRRFLSSRRRSILQYACLVISRKWSRFLYYGRHSRVYYDKNGRRCPKKIILKKPNPTVQNDLLYSFTGYKRIKEVIPLKKHFFPIMCAFLELLSSTAHAATRAAAVVPRISFNGTTASCTVFVAADRPTDDIEAVIKLWQGSKCIETWEASSVGDLAFSGTATVSRGKTYQLTVDVTLEGKAQPRFSVEGTCP